MDKFYHSVRLDEDLCKGCINCIKRCPTQAIRVQDGKARINKKFCCRDIQIRCIHLGTTQCIVLCRIVIGEMSGSISTRHI